MPGPLYYIRVRRQVQRELQSQGHGLIDSIHLSRMLDEQVVDAAATHVGATAAVQAIGDGSILERIISFFNSDLGKALIALLVSILL